MLNFILSVERRMTCGEIDSIVLSVRKPGEKWGYTMPVLRVGRVSCQQVAFHQGDADAQEEQQDGDWADDDPPEVWIGQRYEEIQSPPEEHFTKVVRMGRSRP